MHEYEAIIIIFNQPYGYLGLSVEFDVSIIQGKRLLP